MDLCVSLWVDYCLVNILVEWIYAKKCINKAKQLKIKQTQNKSAQNKHKTKQHNTKQKQSNKTKTKQNKQVKQNKTNTVLYFWFQVRQHTRIISDSKILICRKLGL